MAASVAHLTELVGIMAEDGNVDTAIDLTSEGTTRGLPPPGLLETL